MVYWFDFVYSPPGFYGKDILIDSLSALVVLLISWFSLRNYFLSRKNKRHLLLSLAFLLLGVSFLIKVVTNWLVHNDALIQREMIVPLVQTANTYTVFSAVGFLLHAFLTLFGFYLIYAISSKEELTMNYVIIAYFIVISTFFSRFNYFILYITASVFLVALTRRYFISYKKYKHKNTLRLGVSFLIITLSQVVFIFTSAWPTLYVLAEIIQLIGYSCLLYTFVMVLSNAKQKNKN